MASEFDFELFKTLTEERGIPGYEDRVREVVVAELDERTDRVSIDAMGNVVGTIEGSGDDELVIAAHMDEIGFMVSHVDDDGFLRLDPVGGWDPRVVRAQRVTVHTEADDIVGIIGSTPTHVLDEEDLKKKPKLDDVYVDVGLDGDTAKERIEPGALVTMDQSTERLGDLVTGKALDNRVSVFIMLEAARRITDPTVTVHFAATVQEEVGLRGARALGVDIAPDLALALDVTIANDVPDANGPTITALGDGTAIKLKDSSVITSPKVHRRLRDLAEDRDIPYQIEVLPRGGTDTAAFQVAAGAIPVGAVSIPTRYLHTVTEAAHVDDIVASIDLVTAFVETEDGASNYAY